MSKLAKKPISFGGDVMVKLDGNKLNVNGKKGELSLLLSPGVQIVLDKSSALLNLKEGSKKSFLGLDRSRIFNAIEGVTKGFSKELELVGVGFKCVASPKELVFSLGFSHTITLSIPTNISVKVEKNVLITVMGIDKQLVGLFAASIRMLKKPEPYKGKGIRYKGEVVRKKEGKSSK